MEKVTVYGQAIIQIMKKVDKRDDGLELLEVEQKLDNLLIHPIQMNELIFPLVNNESVTVDVGCVHIEWQEAFGEEGEHSWFEYKDGKRYLRTVLGHGEVKD